jgi:hypothetical protein
LRIKELQNLRGIPTQKMEMEGCLVLYTKLKSDNEIFTQMFIIDEIK